MGIGSFFKRLVSTNDTPAMSDDPFGTQALPTAVAPIPAAPPRRDPALVVQRDEIIGDRARIAGYRLTVRNAESGVIVTPAAQVAALKADNVPQMAQRRLALIPLRAAEWNDADYLSLAAPHTCFLLEATPSDASALDDVLQAIKAAGARAGISAALAGAHPELHLPARVDMALISFGDYGLERFERQVKQWVAAHPDLSVAVDGVGSWVEHRMCQAMGAKYSLGGFASVPDEEVRTEKLNQSRLVLIEMLNLLRRDAEVTDLVEVAKRDPGVAVKLVNMANSPMSGLSAPVASLQQALLVLGREMLYRWLSLGIYRAGDGTDGRDESLLEIALCRARFLELLAKGLRSKQESDELFLVGMISLLDSVLGMPMANVVAQMNLPPVVVDVLLRSEGPYGRFLMLALAMEKGRHEQAGKFADDLGITPEKLAESYAGAFAWAQEAMESL